MRNNTEMMSRLLGIIARSQESTAPVELSIGAVSGDGQVMHDCIVVKDAPARVVNDIVDFVNGNAGVHGSLALGGYLITFY